MTRARDVANLIGSGNYSSTTLTATAGQTAFTIAHTQGFVQVFMNGLLLDETVDYTSNGSAVTLTSGAAAGDEIEVVAYNTFSVGDALNQAAADTRYVNTTGDTMTGSLTGTSAGFTGDVNIGNNASSNPLSKLRLGGTQYGAADIRPTDEGGHKVGMAFYTDGTGDTTIDPVLRMTINSSGHVTMPYQPSAGLRLASGDQGAYNATTTNGVMKPSTILHNIGSHYNNSTGLFTCPVAGRYLVQFSGNFYNSGAGTYHIITIMKNGGSFTWNYDNDMGASWKHISNTTIVSCAANDTLNINNGTQSGSGGGSDVGKYSYISFHYLG